MSSDPKACLDRLVAATNAHDLEAIVDCFAEDYVNETPSHPSRGFTGNAQVRSNWTQILQFVPDLVAEVVASAVEGDSVWSEWRMDGTRLDGSRHQLCGVIVMEVRLGRVASARFYLEPVDVAPTGIDETVRTQVHA